MKNNNLSIFSLLFILSLQLMACDKEKMNGVIVDDPQLVAELNAKSTDTLVYQSNKYILETELYRDFFPGGSIQEKRQLVASIYLVNTDSVAIPDDLEIKQLFVINEQQIWISTPVNGVQPNVPDFKLEKLSIDGPEWSTDIDVDVIIEIIDNLTSEKKYLIAKDQYIERIEK